LAINGIETQYQKVATTTGVSSTNRSSSENVFDSFQKELVNWEMRIKQPIEKEQENDSKGNIQMSEKQWRKLMTKVDNVIDSSNE
jgi:hypothetical protein